MHAKTSDVAYYLLITDIEEDGIAEKAGLKIQDRIVGEKFCDLISECLIADK